MRVVILDTHRSRPRSTRAASARQLQALATTKSGPQVLHVLQDIGLRTFDGALATHQVKVARLGQRLRPIAHAQLHADVPRLVLGFISSNCLDASFQIARKTEHPQLS